MSADPRCPWRLGKLHRRQTADQRLVREEKRKRRGTSDYLGWIGRNHREPLHEARVAAVAPRYPVFRERTSDWGRIFQRPATRPSWAIMARLRRRGTGYGKAARP